MKFGLRIRRELLDDIRRDLERPHEFASERVGFVFCRFGRSDSSRIVVLAHEYMSVLDDEYIDDNRFGALIGANAFRHALEHTLNTELGIFHIHMHAHNGEPRPSRIDLNESSRFVPDFFHVRGRLPHGTMIASLNSISGRAWLTERAHPISMDHICIVGAPLQFIRRSQ